MESTALRRVGTGTVFALAMAANLMSILRTFFLVKKLLTTHEPPPRPLCYQYRHTFIFLSIAQEIITTGSQSTFAALFWSLGDFWLVHLLASILLSSMGRETLMMVRSSAPGFRYFTPVPLLLALIISVSLLSAGILLEGASSIVGWTLASISVVGFRFWGVWERSRIVQDTSTGKTKHLLNLLTAILAFGVSMSGLPLASRTDRLLLSSGAYIFHDLVDILFLVELYTLCFRGQRSRTAPAGNFPDGSSAIQLWDIYPSPTE